MVIKMNNTTLMKSPDQSGRNLQGVAEPIPTHTPTWELAQKHPTDSALPQTDLYKVEKITSLIKYAIISSQITEEPKQAPLSTWLIAETEHNKTRILLKFRKAPYTLMVENLSEKPLNELLKEQDKKQTVHHLIILDFERILAHKHTTVKAVFGTLLNLLDEGCKTSLFYGQSYQLKHRIQMGVITAVTPEIFRKHFGVWNQDGTLTRIIPITYEYTDSTRMEINRYIAQTLPVLVDNTTAKIKRRGHQKIEINNPDIASAIQFFADQVTERLRKFYVARRTKNGIYRVGFNIVGFRMHKMLRLLAKSIAYDRGRNEVNYEDLSELKEFCSFIGLPNEPKLV